MGRLFGTDGVRGVAGKDLNCRLAFRVAAAAGHLFAQQKATRPTVLIGKDTRLSGDMFEASLSAGLCSVGANVVRLGVVPTPAVAYLVKELGADAGVMISASHNPFEYNGIKIFNSQGFKLPDDIEEKIESIVLDETDFIKPAEGIGIGRAADGAFHIQKYIDHIISVCGLNLYGLNIAFDCANGSASATAHKIFSRLGAKISIINDMPDGVNINSGCGSMHMEHICEYVLKNGFDAGFAFDGDADRCLCVDNTGEVIDGDMMLAIMSAEMQANGTLKGGAVVGTVMSNLGLVKYAREAGLLMTATAVGDRYVLEKMMECGYNLGGEQSGHIIFLDHMTTGDGQLSALKILETMKKTGKPLSELKKVMKRFPQVLINVDATPRVKELYKDHPDIQKLITAYESLLGDDGRILVRPSGTEPYIRIMVEGIDNELIVDIANKIKAAIALLSEECK